MLKGKKKKTNTLRQSMQSKATAGAVPPAWGAEHRWHRYGKACGERKVAPSPPQSFSPMLGELGERQEPPTLGSSHCICNTSEKRLADVPAGLEGPGVQGSAGAPPALGRVRLYPLGSAWWRQTPAL